MSARGENPGTWHELLERIISEQGGQAAVASRLCEASGRGSERDFETARRNLANWSSGKAVPQHRNFTLLSNVLKVNDSPERALRWNELYRDARGDPADNAARQGLVSSGRAMSLRYPARFAALLVAALAFASGYWLMQSRADDSRTIGYLPYAELKVGESVIVHAKRGECGKPPPEWYEFAHEVPALQTGRLVDEGLGTSRSNTCGGTTPGRLVRFVAETPGEEEFDLFQRTIKVVVKP